MNILIKLGVLWLWWFGATNATEATTAILHSIQKVVDGICETKGNAKDEFNAVLDIADKELREIADEVEKALNFIAPLYMSNFALATTRAKLEAIKKKIGMDTRAFLNDLKNVDRLTQILEDAHQASDATATAQQRQGCQQFANELSQQVLKVRDELYCVFNNVFLPRKLLIPPNVKDEAKNELSERKCLSHFLDSAEKSKIQSSVDVATPADTPCKTSISARSVSL